jgi:hypothetical protein
MVNRYIYLHKMDNLFIDVKKKSIFYKTTQKREPILRKNNGTVKSYSLDVESYERLVAILKKKEDNEEDFGQKVDTIEGDVKDLVRKMESMEKKLEEIAEKLNSSKV